uniref:Ribosomal silencing factor RsfS n=1 Tax=Chromera velia CCMP2878 TaxID=1169474 RepID=A0A0G4I4R9_9ALVE|eukprot:Cvel_10995.t1-p1 / transcript=Cvel_10995.t1 / gene=Cvel_10995 / organism=Chromera_velia_CCMP2878 / gene_product=hypothetical protein / transcript_product=hypothetical protein / location=Cvel_scaffold677:33326-37193(-) / protein_length=668 / sequence_SO=supercontig / SO=protein_coding / is_pseudo=false
MQRSARRLLQSLALKQPNGPVWPSQTCPSAVRCRLFSSTSSSSHSKADSVRSDSTLLFERIEEETRRREGRHVEVEEKQGKAEYGSRYSERGQRASHHVYTAAEMEDVDGEGEGLEEEGEVDIEEGADVEWGPEVIDLGPGMRPAEDRGAHRPFDHPSGVSMTPPGPLPPLVASLGRDGEGREVLGVDPEEFRAFQKRGGGVYEDFEEEDEEAGTGSVWFGPPKTRPELHAEVRNAVEAFAPPSVVSERPWGSEGGSEMRGGMKTRARREEKRNGDEEGCEREKDENESSVGVVSNTLGVSSDSSSSSSVDFVVRLREGKGKGAEDRNNKELVEKSDGGRREYEGGWLGQSFSSSSGSGEGRENRIENESEERIWSDDEDSSEGEGDEETASSSDRQQGKGTLNEDEEEEEEDDGLTPAQKFYKENKNVLLQRAMKYYSEKYSERSAEEEVCEEWSRTREPVVRPSRDHLWDFGNVNREVPRETVQLQKGKVPSVDQVLRILEQERAMDVVVVNLEDCGRRDLGRYAVVATGQTPKHCKRLGRMMKRIFTETEIPHLDPRCYGSDAQEWHIAHCGPLLVHLLTSRARQAYNLEELWMRPHEHNGSADFPGYFDYLPGEPPPFLYRNATAPSVVPSLGESRWRKLQELAGDYEDATTADDGTQYTAEET